MSSDDFSLHLLNEEEITSEQLFYFINQHISIYINHNEYISDAESDDDDMPELIDDLQELSDDDEYFINTFSEIQGHSLYDTHLYKRVVTEEVYENLKKQSIKFKDLGEVEKIENVECPISLEKFNEEDYIIQLNCGHFFHKEPILYWLYMQKNKCPICRYEYPSIEKRI